MLMRLSITLFLLMLLCSITASAQKKYDGRLISKKTAAIVQIMAVVNEVKGAAVTYSGYRPEQYNYFLALQKTASKGELIELTNHPNGVVRCYAFWALANHADADIFPIVLDHISDTTMVSTLFGCIGGNEMVGDFFINIVSPGYLEMYKSRLDSLQYIKLDSILLFTHNYLWATSRAIARAPLTVALYPRLREMVMKYYKEEALVSLAKYRNQQDIPLILNALGNFYSYRAIYYFPDPAFFTLLENDLKKTFEETHYSNEWSELYQAIAAYRNQKAVTLLTLPFSSVEQDNIRPYHLNYVFRALENNMDSLYDGLLWKMWREEQKITPTVFQHLWKRDSAQAYALVKISLTDADRIYLSNLDDYIPYDDTTENIMTTFLKIVVRKEKPLGIDLITKNIMQANVHQFDLFATMADSLHEKLFIESLLQRLEKEDNPYVYLRIVKSLIRYHEERINERILAVRKKNKNLKSGWGGK